MRLFVFALALISTLAVTTAASADVLLADAEIREANITDERVLVVSVRLLCPEGYEFRRDDAVVSAEQNFGDDIVIYAQKSIGEKLTCDGTWNGIRVRFRKGEETQGGSRRFSRRLPITLGTFFFVCPPLPDSGCVIGGDTKTVFVQ